MNMERLEKLEPMILLHSGNSYYLCTYKNVWDPVKKRSKRANTQSVGKIEGGLKSGVISWKDFFLDKHPYLREYQATRQLDGTLTYVKLEHPMQEFKFNPVIYTKAFGATWVCDKLIERSPLLEALKLTFSKYDDYKKIISIAYFLILTKDNVLSTYPNFYKGVMLPWHVSMGPEEIRRLFTRITPEKIALFLTRLYDLTNKIEQKDDKFLVFCSTSRYRRPGRFSWSAREIFTSDDVLPPSNNLLLCHEQTGIPVYYHMLGDRQLDVVAIRHLLKVKVHLEFGDNVLFVGDRGYENVSKITQFLKTNTHFLINLRRTHSVFAHVIDSVRSKLLSIGNYYTEMGCAAATKKVHFNYHYVDDLGHRHSKKTNLYLHIYFDENVYNTTRERIKQKIALVKEAIANGEILNDALIEIKDRYLVDNKETGLLDVSEKAVQRRLDHRSIRMLVSDTIDDPVEAYRNYFDRNEIWAGFKLFQNRLGSKLVNDDEESFDAKCFIQFLASSIAMMVRKKFLNSKCINGTLPYNCDDVILSMLNGIEISKTDHSTFFTEPSEKLKKLLDELSMPLPVDNYNIDINADRLAQNAETTDYGEKVPPRKPSREELIFKLFEA